MIWTPDGADAAGGAVEAVEGVGAVGAVGAGGGDEGAGAEASVSNRATTVWIGTVFPSGTRISANTPADGAGISASTLSVEISKIGSSRFTGSPTLFSHFERVPSAMDSPIWGMTMSIFAMRSAPLRADRAGEAVG